MRLGASHGRDPASAKLGLKTEIAFDGKGGALTIHYQSLEQLDDLIASWAKTWRKKYGKGRERS